jgi:hypothetical protein
MCEMGHIWAIDCRQKATDGRQGGEISEQEGKLTAPRGLPLFVEVQNLVLCTADLIRQCQVRRELGIYKARHGCARVQGM